MMLPPTLLASLENVPGFSREAFDRVHGAASPPVSIRLNPGRNLDVADLLFADLIDGSVPWTRYGYYLKQRPSFTFDPLFHSGCYYVQEASSMFLEQVLLQHFEPSAPIKVLDLSAAPGGKSTHLQSLLPTGGLLVSNEVIHSRVRILEDNLVKWGAANVVVTRNDPAGFAGLEDFFDLLVVDAPCSGSGLFRRDVSAIAQWSPENVKLCSGRQRRILADVWPALKGDGILVYSTCSFSPEENEQIGKWIQDEFNAVEVKLSLEQQWGITETEPGYRFWPHQVRGEGFYLAVFRKPGNSPAVKNFRPRKKLERLTAAEAGIVADWVEDEGREWVRAGNNVYAWPKENVPAMERLASETTVVYSGVRTGTLKHGKLIPDHALAMSSLLRAGIPQTELDVRQALDYLSIRDLKISPSTRGWQRVVFRGNPLGWINALGNRINNYYPRSMRILKDAP